MGRVSKGFIEYQRTPSEFTEIDKTLSEMGKLKREIWSFMVIWSLLMMFDWHCYWEVGGNDLTEFSQIESILSHNSIECFKTILVRNGKTFKISLSINNVYMLNIYTRFRDVLEIIDYIYIQVHYFNSWDFQWQTFSQIEFCSHIDVFTILSYMRTIWVLACILFLISLCVKTPCCITIFIKTTPYPVYPIHV